MLLRMSRLARSSAGTSFYHNSTPFSKLFGEQTRAPLAGRRDWGPDHLSRGIWELRVSRMSQAKQAGPPLARHLSAQICEDVSSETTNPRRRSNESYEDASGATVPTTRCLRGCLDLPAPRPELASTATAPRSASRLGKNAAAIPCARGMLQSRATRAVADYGGCGRSTASNNVRRARRLFLEMSAGLIASWRDACHQAIVGCFLPFANLSPSRCVLFSPQQQVRI